MKTIMTPLSVLFMVFLSYGQSPFSSLVLEELDNGGVVSGTTYRLYAELNEGLVYAMFADETNPHLIETTTTFFNANLFANKIKHKLSGPPEAAMQNSFFTPRLNKIFSKSESRMSGVFL